MTSEIRVLRPTAILFFTGPAYDLALHDEFPGIGIRPAMGRAERQFAWLRHPSLPSVSIRTYHPAYLRRSPKRWAWLHDIARCVKDRG
jgi:hypothetical protein